MPVYRDGYVGIESDLERNSGLPTKAITTDVWIDPNSGDGVNWYTRHVYVTCLWHGVYRSTNGGQTFAKYSAGMEGETAFSGFKFGATHDGGKLYLIFNPEGSSKNGYPGAMFVLDVAAGTGIWQKIAMPPECDSFREISIDKNGAIYTTGLYKYQSETQLRNAGAFVSVDGGANWRVIYPVDIISHGILVDRNNPDLVFLGNNKGELLRSKKGVNTTADDWEFIAERFPHPKLSSIHGDPANPEWIYVGTVCGGTWHVKLPDTDAPTAEVTYEENGTSVKVTITANEDIKEINGWEKSTGRIYTKTYTENVTEEVEIEDLAGNKNKVQIEVTTLNPNLILPASVSLDPTAVTLEIGDSLQLRVNVLPANATNKKVTWESSHPAIAEVNSAGKVFALSKGITSIVATTEAGGMTVACPVTVRDNAAGTSPIAANNITAVIQANRLSVNSPVSEWIYVYSFNGSLLYASEKKAGEAVFPLPAISEKTLIVRGSSGWVKKIVKKDIGGR
jgi:hypothetical protein